MRASRILVPLLLLTFAAPGWSGQQQQRAPDFDRMAQQQADTDKAFRDAAAGFYQVEKISFRSSAGDLDIPAWVFQPLKIRGPKLHAALVWTHENIRGHL